jgi:hypothetical protein
MSIYFLIETMEKRKNLLHMEVDNDLIRKNIRPLNDEFIRKIYNSMNFSFE